jgi:hypothetical protein
MAGSTGQAGTSEHRGVVLPEGMTPACLDDLAAIINRHQREDSDELDAECAVKVFEVVLRHLG